MRIAILANDAASYVKPMAEGLQRMFARSGVESHVFYDGLQQLSELPSRFDVYIRENGNAPRNMLRRFVKYLLVEAPSLARVVIRLRRYDAIVVVNTIPQAFLTGFFHDDTVRALFPNTPLVLYDVFYLPTRPDWAQWLKDGYADQGIPLPGNWGLERYDWYLCASVVSEVPMPPGPQPCSVVGLDLDDGSLFPGDKSEFLAVLDFECPRYMRERAVQIAALEESKTKYVVLNGHYSISRIRKIYRKASVLLPAMRESFGLPICEVQACGAYVFTPYSEWCPSHWLKEDLRSPGPGELSPNFVVYGNDKDRLVRALEDMKRRYNPQQVVNTFETFHPQLFRGDQNEIDSFVHRLRNREIRPRRQRLSDAPTLTTDSRVKLSGAPSARRTVE